MSSEILAWLIASLTLLASLGAGAWVWNRVKDKSNDSLVENKEQGDKK